MTARRRATPEQEPGLFDAAPPGAIPVGSVRQAAFVPPSDEDEDGAADEAVEATEAAPRGRSRSVPAPAKPGGSARRGGRAVRAVTAETLASKQRDISVSEFFAKNRHLLGFDNKRKALLTTVKEAVDNALDACEEAGHLPQIHVTIDQLAEDRFRVTVRDNGPGIVKAQVPNIFGKLLYGSKFHRLKMSRGQQGIGISAAGMYGLLTTGRSIEVTSRTSPRQPAHQFHIQIDTTKNKPDVIRDAEVEVAWERGTEVTIELVASYAKGRQSVDEYLEQTAIANPHARLVYKAPTGEQREFPRASEELPAETRAIQPHPHGIELGVLMKMLKDARPTQRGERTVGLSSFLQSEFCRVSVKTAQQICAAAGLSPNARAAQIGTHDVEKLFTAMQQTRIMAPPTDCLAPIGVRALLAGLLKEVRAEFFTATTRAPAVYRGNPFQIEIALAFGGNLPGDEAARVIRFANRVPLLYQQSACAAFKSVLDVDWRNYGLSQPGGGQPVGPLVVMIHMASVWVPFTSESKEAIADYDEIRKEMKLALQECGRKLATYIRRRRRQRLESERRDIFSRYIPDLSEALASLTGGDAAKLMHDLQAIARQRTAEADVELDEDGRPIEKPAPEPDEYTNGDDSVIIVPENEAPTVAGDLFEATGENGNGGKPKRRRRRR
jgi:DNA topoisomerase-6 subunit B